MPRGKGAPFAALNHRWNCRVTTIGRKTGRKRTTTVWFIAEGDKVFLTGGKESPNWCRNIAANPAVELKVGGASVKGTARIIKDQAEARSVMDRFVRKYLIARIGRLFGGWTHSVAVVVEPG